VSDLLEAVHLLDHSDDDHWTQDGLPSVEAVSGLIGSKVTRAEITAAAPNIKRLEAKVAKAKEQPKDEDQSSAHDSAMGDLEKAQETLRKAQEAVREASNAVAVTGRGLTSVSPATLSEQNKAYFESQDKRQANASKLAKSAIEAVKAAAAADPVAAAAIESELK